MESKQVNTGLSGKPCRFRGGMWVDFLILGVLWCEGAAAVGVVGDFPINDDWSYGKAVQRLVEEGRFQPTEWTAMPLLSQALWGAMFCLPFGFSFTALRVSTLTLGLLGIYGVYLLLRTLQVPRGLSLFGSLVVGFNPIYFSLSQTFMTDVPFAVFCIYAIYFLVRDLLEANRRDFILGTICCAAAILCRQLGVFIPLAYGITIWIREGFFFRGLLRGGGPFLAASLSLAGYFLYLHYTYEIPAKMGSHESAAAELWKNPAEFFRTVLRSGLIAIIYLGLFLLPWLLIQRSSHRYWKKRIDAAAWILCIGFMGLAAYQCFWHFRIMPLGVNILTSEGIGPVTLSHEHLADRTHTFAWFKWFWIVITAMGILGGGVFLSRMTAAVVELFYHRLKLIQKSPVAMVRIFFIACVAVYLNPFVMFNLFDRYLLPLLPLLIGTFCISMRRLFAFRGKTCFSVAMALFLFLSMMTVCSTRDFMAMHRAKWKALRFLVEQQHIPLTSIDGGFEINGWYLYEQNRHAKCKAWWATDDLYVIGMERRPGYQEVGRFPYFLWIPPHQKGVILILKRQ